MGIRKSTPKELLQAVVYDPSSLTGLRWKAPRSHRVKPGDQAGGPSGFYYRVAFKGKTYGCHIVIWELLNGPIPAHLDVDHKDRNKLNNEISNLRLATKGQNQHNAVSRKSPNGVKGLYWNKGLKKWHGSISHNKIVYRIYDTDKDVVVAWLRNTRTKLHGQFAHH